jgi:hypothetical protein
MGLGHSSEVQHLPSMYKALVWICITGEKSCEQ